MRASYIEAGFKRVIWPRTHIDFAEMMGRFRLDFRFHTDSSIGRITICFLLTQPQKQPQKQKILDWRFSAYIIFIFLFYFKESKI